MKPLTAFLLALLLVVPVQAEDAAPTTFDTARAALPWPAADKAFTFEGHVVVAGSPMGDVKLTAAPRTDSPGWEISMVMVIHAMSLAMASSTTYDAKLTPVRGTSSQKAPDGSKNETWRVIEGGVELTADGAEKPTLVPRKGSFITDVGTIALFCRLSNFAAGTYKTALFDSDKHTFVDAEWTVGKKGTWGDKPAHLVTGTRADGRTLEAGFDATTGALLGMKLADATKSFEFRSGKAPEKKPSADDLFSRAAKTPQEGAVKALVGFATADVDLIASVMHWPTFHEQERAARPDNTPEDLEAFKTGAKADLAKSLKPHGSRDALGPIFKSLIPSLPAEKQESGATLVTFPAQFGGSKMTLREFDGAWLLVSFPTRPK